METGVIDIFAKYDLLYHGGSRTLRGSTSSLNAFLRNY